MLKLHVFNRLKVFLSVIIEIELYI